VGRSSVRARIVVVVVGDGVDPRARGMEPFARSPTSMMIRELAAEVLATPDAGAARETRSRGSDEDARASGRRLTASARSKTDDDADGAPGAFERRLATLETEAETIGTNLAREEAEAMETTRVMYSAERDAARLEATRRVAEASARDATLREALRAKERAIESLSASLTSTRESYERRLRVETEANAANAAREESMRAESRSLGERLRSLETKAEVREQKISMQEETIESLTRQVEAKRTFDAEVADHARALEMDRLEERVKASEARAKASEEKLEKYFIEKVSLEREIESLRERLASAPSQESRDAEFRARVEREAETKIATERLVNEEMKTRAELNEVFKQIRDLTLRSAGITSAPLDPVDVQRELARVKRASEEEIESRRLEFQTIQAEVGRENARLRRELSDVRKQLDDKLRPRHAKPDPETKESPWAAEFSFPAVDGGFGASPSGSCESFIELSPNSGDLQ
jgi:chromosome segregation ATPase